MSASIAISKKLKVSKSGVIRRSEPANRACCVTAEREVTGSIVAEGHANTSGNEKTVGYFFRSKASFGDDIVVSNAVHPAERSIDGSVRDECSKR